MHASQGIPIVLFAVSFFCGGCSSGFKPPSGVLIVVSRVPDASKSYDVHRCAITGGALQIVETTRVGPAARPPRPLMLTRQGEWVGEVRDSTTGPATLRWSKGEGEAIEFDEVLDIAGARLLLARRLSHENRPAMRVDRGVIREINPPWAELVVCDVDRRTLRRPLERPVLPVARVGPSEWLVLADPNRPELRLLEWREGTSVVIAPWPRERRFVGAVLSPNRAWAAIASQTVGRRWNLFDVDVWDRASQSLKPLVSGVFVATRPESRVGPSLAMGPINNRHLALVTTVVDRWRDRLPVGGSYYTAIADVETRAVFFRIRHSRSGLQDEVPPPYLPAEQLASLRIERVPDGLAGLSGDSASDDRWRRFLTFRAGRLVTADGATYAPDELELYAYGSDGRAVAMRRRRAPTDPGADQCVVIVDESDLPLLRVPNIERLTWLPSREP